jgi:hypothetical protein
MVHVRVLLVVPILLAVACGGSCCCNHITAEDGYPVVPPATGHAVCFGGMCMAVGQ